LKRVFSTIIRNWSPCLRKGIAIIDPSRREESLKVVEGLELGEFFKANLLAELRRRKTVCWFVIHVTLHIGRK
jgi:hypothetical protein